MVRTQIQLTERQSIRLRALASRHRLSVAEIIRRAVDDTLAAEARDNHEEARRRAISAIGCVHSGVRDLSEKHDDYVLEAYGE